VSYSIDIDSGAQNGVAAFPRDALLALAEAFAVLELAPWSAGRSVNPERNPTPGFATSRSVPRAWSPTWLWSTHFGVDILLVTWAGMS
jgi:hypothetical protein